MANIYDDVEALQTAVATLQTQVAALQPQVLVENIDLNTLTVGRYIIPTTAVSATLLNKPITQTWTGFY